MMKRSKAIDSLLENFVINFESATREDDYQLPSILYICGGSAENNNKSLIIYPNNIKVIIIFFSFNPSISKTQSELSRA